MSESKPLEWIESEEFDHTAYNYRAAPMAYPEHVAQMFAALKTYVRIRAQEELSSAFRRGQESGRAALDLASQAIASIGSFDRGLQDHYEQKLKTLRAILDSVEGK